MNWKLKRALKRRMPTDVEMEAMGCRYLTAEELDAIFGGRPDDGDINDACPPGGNFGGDYSGGSSSGDSSDSGSSGSFSGDSSSGDNGGQSGASGNSSNSDNSSSKDYSIQPGDTLAGITHEHYPDLTGQDFVDKVNEIAAANGLCAFGNGVKAFVEDPIGTAKSWFGGGKSGTASQYNSVTNSSSVSWPTDSRRVTSEFDAKSHPHGIDIGAITAGVKGDTIKASVAGEVTVSGVPSWSASQSSYVVVKGDDSREYRYAHLEISETISVGSRVNQGDILGYMSDLGSPGQVHLHFEVLEGGSRISPRSILP